MERPDELIAQHGFCRCPSHSPPPHCVCGDDWPCPKGVLADHIRRMESCWRKTMAGKDTFLAICADHLNRIDDAKAAIGAEIDRKKVTPDAFNAVADLRAATDQLEEDLKHIESGDR